MYRLVAEYQGAQTSMKAETYESLSAAEEAAATLFRSNSQITKVTVMAPVVSLDLDRVPVRRVYQRPGAYFVYYP